VTEKLLAINQVDSDAEGDLELTPLAYATVHNHAEVVRLLLATSQFDANEQSSGGTALSYAIEFADEEVVRILFKTEEVGINLPGDRNRS
jgi:ankyrin repeat protein